MVSIKDFITHITNVIDKIIQDKTIPSHFLYKINDTENITLKELIDMVVEYYAEDIKKLQKLRLVEFGTIDLKEILYEEYKDVLDKKIFEL